MMGIIQPCANVLPFFQEYLTHKFEQKNTRLVAESNSTVVPMMMVRKEVFNPTDQDNKDSTSTLEELAVLACTGWRDEMVDPKNGTWQFLSDLGGELSFEHSSEEDKLALRGMMAVNDLAESSFAGLTVQVQVFG